MKINFDKSEIFTLGITEEEKQQAVGLLNCKPSVFPMKYLGLPVSDRKMSKAQLKYVSDKAEKRWVLGSVTICPPGGS